MSFTYTTTDTGYRVYGPEGQLVIDQPFDPLNLETTEEGTRALPYASREAAEAAAIACVEMLTAAASSEQPQA